MKTKKPMKPTLHANLEKWADELSSELTDFESVCIALLNESGDELYKNKPFQLLVNENLAQNLINPTFSNLVAMPATPLCFQGLLTIGNVETNQVSVETKIWHKDGEILIVGQLNWIEIIGQFNKMSRLNQEISNLQRQLIKEKTMLDKALKELRETQTQLIHSEKMNAMGQLVAGVAHEINNPISFVSGNLYHLQSAFHDLKNTILQLRQVVYVTENNESIAMADEIIKEFDISYLVDDMEDLFKGSKEGVSRIKKIVDNLRTFSRLDEAGHMTIDLIANILSTLAIIEPEMKNRGINFTMDAPEKLMLECYPSELNQVILNLLINSTQAIEKDGEIHLKVYQDDENAAIELSDNGCGISDEIKDKVFNPFFTTKPVGSGTGLGLSIAYKIITDLHRGSIDFKSEMKKGTTFFIKLPKHAITND